MRIYKWLSDSMSAVIGLAIVEVDAGEVADHDKMVALVDDGLNFGATVTVMTVDTPPDVKWDRNRGFYPKYDLLAIRSTPSEMINHKRYYKVHVSRD